MLYYQNDFLFFPPDIPEKSVDLCLTAPPLSVLENHLHLLFSQLKPIMSEKGYIIMETPYLSDKSDMLNLSIFQYQGLHSYEDTGFVSAHGYGSHRELHVFTTFPVVKIACFKKPLHAPRNREPSHRCEWCPDIVKLLIDTYSKKGDVVLDSFCGTGTVPGEADKVGRKGIGIDVRPFENLLGVYKESVENYD